MIDFTTAINAGVTQTELAKALDVSRITVNLWVNKKMNPHRYNIENIRERMELLNEAIAQGLIPRARANKAARHEAIAAAMSQVQSQAVA